MPSSSALVSPTVPVTATTPAFDFVSSDFDDLSSHMAHCSAAQGRWSALRSGLRQVHSIAAGRLVTLTCVAVAAIVVLATFA